MIALSGADVVLPDRVVQGGSIVIDQGRIAAIEPRAIDAGAGRTVVDLANYTIVPGFVDVHVHGIEGVDVLDGPDAVDDVAKRLPKYGVTAFCPTSVACTPARLTTMLSGVARALSAPVATAARVLPAHLESNFINPEWNGAQPIHCLRTYKPQGKRPEGDFAGHEILQAIVSNRQSVGIITLAPEISGGLDLVRDLVMAGHRVSLGHTGATYDQARDAIALGAHHATHLFNRMSSLTSRSPGVVGAVLESDAVTAEIICDGHHVHPSLVAVAIRVKSVSRMMAITDAVAVAGLPAGSRARLGEQTIIAGEKTAVLENGTIAGSILTMDAAFRMLVKRIGLSLPDAARMCATTPADAMKAADIGAIAPGKWADLTVLDRDLRVSRVFVGGDAAGN
ncbi:MAG TPA: N-acetylglucosamine-6-phosphate deacetylase [Vicinamibacterales bacterium]|nr:N-acetylglucosamine-6-phosphate deacetylase [Vicinamibacterales bacterium]